MTKRIYFLLFLLGILVILPVTYVQSSPGYMDADYYFAGGVRLVDGYGFSEMVLWNYLDNPTGLPHPSHGYWMPLASLVAALGMYLASEIDFSTAKLGFLLIAALLPAMTAVLAYMIHARREQAIFSGVLAAFPVFYLAFLGTTDTFGIYMLLGAVWFILVGKLAKVRNLPNIRYSFYYLLLGIVSGLMHLARADGVLWFLLGLISIVAIGYSQNQPCGFVRRFIMPISLFILGYLLLMGPWMLRNLTEFGTPLAPGGIRTLWLSEYNDLYTYPASTLTFERWWSTGISNILSSRVFVLGQNLQTSLVVQGGIILAPFLIIGMWRLRKDLRVQIGFIAWVTTFFIMTFVFSEIGWRGGFFHSGAALQPLFWAAVPIGFEAFIEWGVRLRGWDKKQAEKGFGMIIFVLIAILTIFITWRRAVGPDFHNPIWNQDANVYKNIEKKLLLLGADGDDIVIVNNAPGYYASNNRPAISIPNGSENISLSVAHQYGGRYLILDKNHPKGLEDLYINPTDLPGIEYLLTINNSHIFLFDVE